MNGPDQPDVLADGAAGQAPLELEGFYPYGYRGRSMFAVRAHAEMPPDGALLVGRVVRIAGQLYRVKGVLRQNRGVIRQGEPIGLELAPLPDPG